MTTMINGRTYDEIKRGLECCFPKYESQHWTTCNSECPFRNEGAYCRNVLHACIKRYIQRLECERDTAVELLHGFCGACANEGKHEICVECSRRLPFEPDDKDDYWQWRGVEVVN